MKIYEELDQPLKEGVKKLFFLGFVLANFLLITAGLYYGTLARQAFFTADDGRTVHQLNVTGEGTVTAKPDTAIFTISIRTENTDKKVAQDENSEKSKAVTSYLKGHGVSDKDIKTTSYNVQPQYQYYTDVCREGICPPRTPKITGYEVFETFEVKVRGVNENSEIAGTILDGVVAAGANDVSGPTLTIDDPKKLEGEARAKAIADAKEKAKTLASDLGVGLGRIAAFNEAGGGYPIYYAKEMSMGVRADAMAAPTPSIQVGENEIKVQVTLTYEIW